jgi:putative aldouronate transport system permease protein
VPVIIGICAGTCNKSDCKENKPGKQHILNEITGKISIKLMKVTERRETVSYASSTRTGKKLKIVFILILGLVSIAIIGPLLYIISISFSSDKSIVEYGYRLIPKEISWQAYKYLFSAPGEILNAYAVSISVTVCGTILGIFLSTTLAYLMSRKDYKYAKFTTFFVFFTMLFNGGVVPWYMVMKNMLHLGNTFFALFIPYGVSAWFTLLMKGFMASVPFEIIESGTIDGASEYKIFAKLVLPICKPALATIALFYAFMYWNDWWLAMLFISNEKLVPLQYMLYRMLNNLDFLLKNISTSLNVDFTAIPSESIRMAVAVLAAGPMLFIFPFFQKYFVRGMTVGSVKG